MPSHVRAYLTHHCALQIDITDITYYVTYPNTQWVMMNICDCVCTVVVIVVMLTLLILPCISFCLSPVPWKNPLRAPSLMVVLMVYIVLSFLIPPAMVQISSRALRNDIDLAQLNDQRQIDNPFLRFRLETLREVFP